MLGSIPKRPKEAMNTRTLNAKFAAAEEFPDTFVTPESTYKSYFSFRSLTLLIFMFQYQFNQCFLCRCCGGI